MRWGSAETKGREQISIEDIIAGLKDKGLLDLYERHAKDNDPPSFYFVDPWGIHGVLHAKRVLLLNLAISCLNCLDQKEIDLLVQASLYHDIGRAHNGICNMHGKESYKKMVNFGLINADKRENRNILKFIVENHCVNDNIALSEIKNYRIGERDRAIKLFNIFKDSDALDRVRLGDLDTRYLRNSFSPRLVVLANHLLEVIK